MNKYNDLLRISKSDYFLFGHPELLTKEGQNHHDKIRNDFFNEVAVMLKDEEYNKLEKNVSQKHNKNEETNNLP